MAEGDLWIKRNCIRLTRKPLPNDASTTSRPFYLFSDNCSEKEDFYHAMLQSQAAGLDSDTAARPQRFETAHIIKLVQNLHVSDETVQTRWLNAMIGRIFLALYKTEDLENFVRAKFNRKISRVHKPNFISSITIQDIDMGDSAPVITNPKLRELTVEGDMTIEADVKYNGGFKLQIAAVARIDLGSRFKVREVDLILAGILRKLSGHVLIRIKPPPSNRLWISFEHMPQIEMSIEPVVSSRQITYGVILRAIESRIREVIGETLVFPNWDDSPFLDTSKKEHRGGIWENNKSDPNSTSERPPSSIMEKAVHTAMADPGPVEEDDIPVPKPGEKRAKTMSMPVLADLPTGGLSLRNAAKKSVTSLTNRDSGNSTAVSTASTSPAGTPAVGTPLEKPRAMRSNSFASTATPVVSVDGANVQAVKSEHKKKRGHRDAIQTIKGVKLGSGHRSAHDRPASSSTVASIPLGTDDVISSADEGSIAEISDVDPDLLEEPRRSSEPLNLASSTDTLKAEELRPAAAKTFPFPAAGESAANTGKEKERGERATSTLRGVPTSSLNSAAAAAKKWSWQVLSHTQKGRNASASASTPNTTHDTNHSTSHPTSSTHASTASLPHDDTPRSTSIASLNSSQSAAGANSHSPLHKQPMGRGQPLPPPGTPLPGPQKSLWAGSTLNLGLKRKPVPPTLPARRSERDRAEEKEREKEKEKAGPPPLPARRRGGSGGVGAGMATERSGGGAGAGEAELMVVAAPDEGSVPSTPVAEVAPVLSTEAQAQPEPEAPPTPKRDGPLTSQTATASEDDGEDGSAWMEQDLDVLKGLREEDMGVNPELVRELSPVGVDEARLEILERTMPA